MFHVSYFMFILFIAIFVVFLVAFGFLAWAGVYHLRQYAPDGLSVANVVISVFLLITASLFIFAVYFFLQIPR
jgi:hypothetical protein